MLARACLLLAAASALTPVPPVAARTTHLRAPVPSVARRTTILRAEAEEANVGTAVRNIAPWLLFVLVEPALRIPNYKECVAEKGHEACANLLPSRAASSEKCIHRVDGFASTAQRPAGSSSGSTSTA